LTLAHIVACRGWLDVVIGRASIEGVSRQRSDILALQWDVSVPISVHNARQNDFGGQDIVDYRNCWDEGSTSISSIA
jgi:hypothetical protein